MPTHPHTCLLNLCVKHEQYDAIYISNALWLFFGCDQKQLKEESVFQFMFSQSHCVAKDDLKLVVALPQPPEY